MQGLVLQLTRIGFLLLLWLFVYAVIRTLRADIASAGGSRLARYTRGDKRDRSSARTARGSARYLVVTQGALANTRITLGTQPVLLGRADDSTLVLTDDYASERHARLSRRGDDWYVEDLGSTNGTYIGTVRITQPTTITLGTQVRIGKTILELRK